MMRAHDEHTPPLDWLLEPDPANPQYFRTLHGIGYKFVGNISN